MDFGYLYTSFDGRINRKPYWLAAILLAVVGIGLAFLLGAAMATIGTSALVFATLLIQLILLYPSVALMVKRLHDRNHPGWWAAFIMVPVVLQSVTNLLGITGDPFNMGPLDYVLTLVIVAVGIWFFVELGCRRGTAGPNDYGPDPLGGEIAMAG
jgi:uncharacterized membrane protein YhaH (DUF805 family)